MRTLRKIMTLIIAAVLMTALAISGCQIYQILNERHAADAAYEELDRFMRFPEADQKEEPENRGQEAGADQQTAESDISGQAGDSAGGRGIAFPEIDFDSLRKVNGQVVGWIYGEGIAVNYPIAQAADNEYYLKRMFNGQQNSSGAIFLDYRNQSDFSDAHSIIYGHHMKSGAMFAALSKYKDQAFYEEHPRMLLMTPERNYVVEIFAGYVADADEEAWETGFASDEEYEAWISRSIARSGISTGIVPMAADRILTLSTCSYEFEGARFVLLGILR